MMAPYVGEKHPQWKGDEVGYGALHLWIRTHKPKPADGRCEDCGKVKPLEAANISGKYLRDVNDFEWICRKCHMKKDGRAARMAERKATSATRKCQICGGGYYASQLCEKHYSRQLRLNKKSVVK